MSAFIAVGIPDIRGVVERTDFNLNNQKLSFVSGIITDDVIRDLGIYNENYGNAKFEKIITSDIKGGSASGLSVAVPSNILNSKSTFAFDLKLKGSERIAFVPVGKTTDVNVSSKWRLDLSLIAQTLQSSECR